MNTAKGSSLLIWKSSVLGICSLFFLIAFNAQGSEVSTCQYNQSCHRNTSSIGETVNCMPRGRVECGSNLEQYSQNYRFTIGNLIYVCNYSPYSSGPYKNVLYTAKWACAGKVCYCTDQNYSEQ